AQSQTQLWPGSGLALHHLRNQLTEQTVDEPVAGKFQAPGMPIRTSDYPANGDYRAPRMIQKEIQVYLLA
ncbi:MAG: hypothetical protein DRR06_06565, partial [Gammaproteobacteria bacterium]